MNVARVVGGLLMAFIGGVWALQGLGSEFVPQSFMTNSLWWVVIGLLTAAAGVVLVVRALRRPY